MADDANPKPEPPLPNIGSKFWGTLVIGFVLLAAFGLILTLAPSITDRPEFIMILGGAFLFAAAAVLIWEVVVAVAATLDPRSKPAGTEQTASGATVDVSALITAISASPKWLALAVVGLALLLFGLMLDGYRFADGGITRTPAAQEVLIDDVVVPA